MEENVVRSMQCDSHIQETDITSPNKSNNEVWKLGNVLRRRCGDSVINPRVSHRAIGRSVSCMKGAELKCNPSKCEISKDSKTYFGRMVDKHDIRPDTDAVEVVLTWKSPKTAHQLLSFLGFSNSY